MTKALSILGGMLLCLPGFAQEIVVTDSTAIQMPETEVQDTTGTSGKTKVDGVAAVVGDFVVLESDIDKMYVDLKSQGISTQDVTRCNLAGRLLENNLYAHHAIQDSIVVPDSQVNVIQLLILDRIRFPG